ncbi:MAG: patatin-like phospholipase family protein [Erysipelotrichaceae bacterium]|nr:patatin-like phospholipase family protein [Erysipelotrichaceae bacterium]
MEKVNALVLAGGGSKGAYQIGAIKALKKLGYNFDIVTGTSIGALNGCMVAQGDYEELYKLWDNIKLNDVVSGIKEIDFKFEEIVNNKNMILSFFKKYIQDSGADISPFKKMIETLFDAKKLKKSKIDFFAVAVSYPNLKPVFIDKKMMLEKGVDYLISSASCFPAFPIHKFENQSFIDGGYFDNLPINLALSNGANNIIVIDLNSNVTHPRYLQTKFVEYIFPRFELGSFLDFDREVIDRNIRYGFNDVYKKFGMYDGFKYTFKKFENPTFFSEFYILFLKIEPNFNKNNNLNDDSNLTKYFMNKQHKTFLDVDDLNYGVIDEIMEILDMKKDEVYDYFEIENIILDTFKKGFDKEYEILPSLNIDKIKEFFDDLNRVGMISKVINQILYDEKRIMSDDIIYMLNPIDVVIANWIILLNNGKSI